MRKKKLALNTVSAIINQIITLVCGMILPKLIISNYGSSVNGLVSSITQFLAFFSMLDMGVGAVVRASLYKPLADSDMVAVSKVLISSKRFFNKLGYLLCGYTSILMVFYPLLVDKSIGFLSTSILVGALSFSAISNYLFGIIYQQLLNADQKSYVQLIAASITTILNTVFGILMIYWGASIEMVKLTSAIVLLLRPAILFVYTKKHYKLDLKLELNEEPLKQKWNGLSQHIAMHILRNADVVILTFFSTLENVSIYYVYHLVTDGLGKMVEVLTSGFTSLLGDMYARKERKKLNDFFSVFEWAMHMFVTGLFTIATILVIPFVSIYTKNITDANYVLPVFAAIIILANATFYIRMPYYMMVQVAGHFKETQNSAIIEALLNVVVSVMVVKKYGLVGVAVGTLLAMIYRTGYLVKYLSNNILNRNMALFFKNLLLDIIIVITVILATSKISLNSLTWGAWIIMAMKVSFITLCIIIVVNLLFERKKISMLISMVKH